MDYGPHSNFVPQSSMSYSNSYAPAVTSPLKEQQNQAPNQLQNTLPQTAGTQQQRNKSILKNPAGIQQRDLVRPRRNSGAGMSNSEPKKPTAQPTLIRKDSLKTVAFGLTTNLDDTVLAKEGHLPASNKSGTHNNRPKVVIFSNEAQSLYRLINAQKEEIDDLRRLVNELSAADEQHRAEAREQMNIIADLSTRLIELEHGGRHTIGLDSQEDLAVEGQAKARDLKADGNKQQKTTNGQGNGNGRRMDNEKAKSKPANGDSTGKKKRTALSQKNQNDMNETTEGHRGDKEARGNPPVDENLPMPLVQAVQPTNGNENVNAGGGGTLQHRQEIMQRLEFAMRRNPTFEQRVQTMLRVWTEDVSGGGSPLANYGGNQPAARGGGHQMLSPDNDGSCGPSQVIVLTRTTQHQELFYSTSPGRRNRNRRQPPLFPRPNQLPTDHQRHPRRAGTTPAHQQQQSRPLIEHLDDDDDEEERQIGEEEEPVRVETMPNLRRSDHCTDDAEFFQPQHTEDGDNDGDDCGEEQQREYGQQNHHQQHQQPPFTRRRQREANSTVRNRYR